ncbi:MAG: polyribonucleotide nucleotidyltransferase [Lewinellaceae bacterium]|nr:polyribonucleotide nucleotidyltransferase [Saprospiraceae bacterium]MCB9340453.1 polyribonucleotide nucleotidyltransferase [Lewinellaceae bacterium]
MGKQIPTTTSFNLPDGREVVIETGKLAAQADGSVVVRVGKTMMLATVVAAKKVREGQSFFPLSVDYQEKFASAGRIPGNFFRRESKLSDSEVLISRLVDRAIRPLFPDGFMEDTQVIINLMSGEKEELPDAYAALAASSALTLSEIPWQGPISEVRVARVNGEFVINPAKSAADEADLNLIVAADLKNIMMVEGEAKECGEKDIVDAIRHAHEAIKVQCQAQLELAQKVGGVALQKREFEAPPGNEEIKQYVEKNARDRIYEVAKSFLEKQDRKAKFDEIKEDIVAKLTEEKGEEYMEENAGLAEGYFDDLKKKTIRHMVLDDQVRLDGRKYNEIRHIWTEIDYLPSPHGSAIFTRGETQSLTTVTLGTKLDEMMVDNAMDQYYEKFILHYNFPPYSTGETKPLRAPGRREVGHANLAGRSLKQVMPEGFPYTVRIVSDILESNGSSSMATVCAGSLALMDAGVPIKAAVSGIAMGMIAENGKAAILSDILGDEDALGDMDFKVTGTANGICACQMDIKVDGLSYELLEKALVQAKEGRLHILSKMAESISEPRPDMKPHAPRIVELIIDKSFIGAVIGPGGKVIQEIQSTTGTIINISEVGDHGIVNVASPDKSSIDKAVARIREITFTPSVGDVYEAVVKTVMPYGVFVDFSGKSGLLHVTEMSHSRIDNVEDVFSEGDPVKVKLIGIDNKTGKFRLSRKALMPKADGTMPADDEYNDNGNGGGGGDRRGGGGRDRGGDRRGGGGFRGGRNRN